MFPDRKVSIIFLAAALVVAMEAVEAADITMTAREFSLTPESVTVRSGENVHLTLENRGVLAHNVSIPELEETSETIQSEATTTLQFEAPQRGSYEIVCSVPGHEQAGMRAILHVE